MLREKAAVPQPSPDAATTLAEELRRIARDSRMAPSGDGELAFTWTDKPHRVVYGLASACERAADMLLELEEERDRHASRLEAVTGWLDKHERSVFRRGLWDAIAEADAARNATQEKP